MSNEPTTPEPAITEPQVAAALRQAIDDYLAHLRVERGLSTNTITAYQRDLNRYAIFLTGRGVGDIAEVSPAEVSEFQRELSGDLAPASITRAVVAVRNLHKFALSDGQAAADPSAEITPPKIGRRLPKALSIDQVTALLDSVDTTTIEGLRDKALLELLYGTGARVSEVCDLDVDDLTRAGFEGVLRLVGKGDKERIVPLGSFARAAVDAWLVRGRPEWIARAKNPSPALLLNTRGARLSRQSAWAVIASAAKRAKLSVEVSPHSLRHSFATHLLDGGADVRVVQELLGHASVTTTQIYTLVTVEHLREVYKTSHPRAY